jgi:hypothetical protein
MKGRNDFEVSRIFFFQGEDAREEKGNVGYIGVAGGQGQGWFAHAHSARGIYGASSVSEGRGNQPPRGEDE